MDHEYARELVEDLAVNLKVIDLSRDDLSFVVRGGLVGLNTYTDKALLELLVTFEWEEYIEGEYAYDKDQMIEAKQDITEAIRYLKDKIDIDEGIDKALGGDACAS
jgi:hypothetical protein